MLISFCNTLVCIANSTTNEGRHLGFSCTDKLTLPLRYPNKVPVTLLPEIPRALSNNPPERTGILHAGDVIMGKVRKTERKIRKTLGLCFFFWGGWTRDNCWCCVGGSGGDGGGFGVLGVSGKSSMDTELPRGNNSPMNGLRCSRKGRLPSERQRDIDVRFVRCWFVVGDKVGSLGYGQRSYVSGDFVGFFVLNLTPDH